MKIKKYILILLGAISLSSCDSFLDVKPKGYTIPELFEDYEKLMNYSGVASSLDVYPSFFTDDILLTSKDETTVTWFDYTSKNDQQKNLYTFEHGQTLVPGNSDAIWDGAYKNIFVYNAVINNVMSAPDASDKEKKRLQAEALIGRAFEYMNLVNVFAKHYDVATAETDYGVPLVLSEEVNHSYKRNTVAEVYRQIESDLNTATPNLSETVSQSFRPNKSIGYAFLSRMYLYMGKYEEALTNANKALELSHELTDFKLYTTQHSTFGRIILESDPNIQFPEKQDSPENIYIRMLGGTSYIYKSVAASKDLINTYKSNLASNGEDMRLRLFFATDEANFTMNAGSKPQKFVGYSTYCPYIVLNVGFTTPEIYLIAAECEARVGSIANALKHLNTLRDMRIKNNIQYLNTPEKSREEALKLVIDERRREFAFIGITRLVDLKRLNRESWFAKTITHSAEGETWTLPANDPRYIMPVPQTVLDYNPDMPQYER